MSNVVSIILNLHDEAEYLDRTCQSLLEAVCFGRSHGFSFELVVVLDKATADVQDWCRRYDFERIATTKFVEISAGSLAKARQAGLDACTGDFVSTADADDLISFNYFAAAGHLLCKADARTVVAHELMFAFGTLHNQQVYFPSSMTTTLMPFLANPYTSRISVRRDFILEVGYAHPRAEMGEAYEDWDITSRILASKGNFQIARDTVLFYRWRASGIMGAMTGLDRLPRQSAYHEPHNFIASCQIDYERYLAGRVPAPPGHYHLRRAVLNRPQIQQMVAATNLIDAGVRLEQLEWAPTGSNLHGKLGWGAAYYEACQKIAGKEFTDVVLLPYVIRGGGEKYIFNIIKALREHNAKRSFLILGGENIDVEQALDLLPEGAVYVDLYKICQRHAPEAIDLITLRLIKSIAGPATLHLKTAPYAHHFLERFGSFLGERIRTIYYCFSDPPSHVSGLRTNQGHSFEFVSKNHKHISTIVSDHEAMLRHLSARIPIAGKCATISAYCEPGEMEEAKGHNRRRAFAMLWASRLDPSKHPELLPMISLELGSRGFDCSIDVYGAPSVYHQSLIDRLSVAPLSYKGGFRSFGDIPTQLYDALIYTSHHDGLPNVILEAMAAGLPVIVPRIGGIPEAVDETRGIIVDADCGDDELAVRYADAVVALSRMDLQQLGRNGAEFVRRQHSFEGLVEAVKAAGI